MTTEAGTPDGHTTYTVDELLIAARASLPHRPSPAEALAAQATGALLIDIRGDDQRRTCGLIPGALLLPRNALEWRCDPTGQWRHPAVNGLNQHLILICQEGSSRAWRPRPCNGSGWSTPPTWTGGSPPGPRPGYP